ncbi:uncharacterized protein LOC133841403 isoform X1 [Drosophila sulfurigaster albostrigata]|uniref:uncharacterized protein LOC133841403 isoform X1 n=1 Tax=Drosophila sulfurigaster albostrigata TaxID=89887 RepID=UPI002D21B9E8|nr:uncharacterized protein LOC133841403 isoform X1 [Drosophila sulfurigaster albostrigata]
MISRRFSLLVALISPIGIYAFFEFNNAKCIIRNPEVLTFDYCYLRSVNRTYKYFSMKTKFLSLPVDNTWVSLKVYKRDNRHIFDRYNVTVDGCRFLRERNNALVNVLFGIFEEFSNLNHTCPFDHDILIEKLPVQHVNTLIKYIVPDGRYILNTTWSIRKVPFAEIIVYFTKF